MSDLFLNFIQKDMSSSKYWRKKLQDFIKFVYFVQQGLLKKYCLQRAAGMAYSSLFALVPVFVVFLSILSSVNVFPKELKLKIENFIFQNFIPETSQKLSEKVAFYVQEFANSATAIGVIGTVFMIITTFFLLNTIENTFNSIMFVEKKRTFMRKLNTYTSFIVWSPVFLGLSYVVQSGMDINYPLLSQIKVFYHYAFITLVFTLAYKIIPNQFISTKDALIGAICATVLWKLAHKSFTHLIAEMLQFDKIYGTLGTVPLFLVWLYMVWVVVLIGMEITYVSQNIKYLSSDLEPEKNRDTIAFFVMKKIGNRYLNNSGYETEESLLNALPINQALLSEVIDKLSENNFITSVNSEPKYTLTKHPQNINLWDIASKFVTSIEAGVNNRKANVVYKPLMITFPENLSNISLEEWLNVKK